MHLKAKMLECTYIKTKIKLLDIIIKIKEYKD